MNSNSDGNHGRKETIKKIESDCYMLLDGIVPPREAQDIILEVMDTARYKGNILSVMASTLAAAGYDYEEEALESLVSWFRSNGKNISDSHDRYFGATHHERPVYCRECGRSSSATWKEGFCLRCWMGLDHAYPGAGDWGDADDYDDEPPGPDDLSDLDFDGFDARREALREAKETLAAAGIGKRMTVDETLRVASELVAPTRYTEEDFAALNKAVQRGEKGYVDRQCAMPLAASEYHVSEADMMALTTDDGGLDATCFCSPSDDDDAPGGTILTEEARFERFLTRKARHARQVSHP